MNNLDFKLHCPIKEITTYKTEGFVPAVIFPKSVLQCKELLETLSRIGISYKVIGNGSNLLISPHTTKVFISLQQMTMSPKLNGNTLTLPASFPIAKVLPILKKHHLGGLEKVATIPACVGGLIKNNASFCNQTAFDHLEKITLLRDGKIFHIKKDQIIHSYRKTEIPNGIILSATFKLPQMSAEEIDRSWKKAIFYRASIQPKGFSCGCVFKNSEKFSAGNLIDKCGLKGKTKGDAIISPKHANFIINQGNATFDDVKYLIEYCEEEVFNKFRVTLEREVEIIE